MGSLSLRCLLLFFLVKALTAQSVKVSPKLDFGEQSDLVQVRKELKTGKIKGLRVTVDTSELKESKSSGSESSSSSESSEKRKTIGVRTDVTFEITSGETNDTKTVDEKEIGKEDDNASIPIVPVFKGTPDRGSRNGGSKDNDIWSVKPLEFPSPPTRPIFHSPHDDRNRYGGGDDRNRYGGVDDRKRYGGVDDRNRHGGVDDRNRFGGIDDRNRFGGIDDRNRFGGADDHNRYGGLDETFKQNPQFAIWTTERYNLRKQDQPVYHHRGQYDGYEKPPPSNFIPYQIQHDRHMPWQPCNCKEYPGPYINPQQPSSDELHRSRKVDDKLDKPFSKTS